MPTKIVFVKQGISDPKSYEDLIKVYTRLLLRHEVRNEFSHQKENADGDIKVVTSIDELRERASQTIVHVAVFLSVSMVSEARMLREDFPNMRVVCMVGCLPDDGTLVLYKTTTSNDTFLNSVFGATV